LIPPTPNETNKNQQPTRIQGNEILDPTLLHHNIDHFAQAKGSPFTISPLLEFIGEDGCSYAAMDVLNGNVPDSIDKYSTMILQQMTKKREPVSLIFTFQDMCTGLRKWREQTTISPSNKHLGIYKSLLNAIKYNIYTTNETDNQILYSSKINIPTTELALQIQHTLMTLAIQHCHTFNRWKILDNFMLEKIPGIP
jgi:hypothetical protein